MADIRCPNCGRNNPDFLDLCQFCQSPLKSDATLHTGDSPVKKNTGELEPILPQWLQDVRQQARESAAADAAAEAARPKVQNEPPDLLAGLASQARQEEEEVPDWLASINPSVKPNLVETESSQPATDFFAQFARDSVTEEPEPSAEVPAQGEASWMATDAGPQPVEEEKDELSEWFTQAAAEPEQKVEVDEDAASWMGGSDSPAFRIKEPEPPKEEEDLDWLHSLEAESAKPAMPSTQEVDPLRFVSPESAAGGDDLSWLNELGGAQASIPEETASASQTVESESEKTGQPQSDLGWLDRFGDITSAPDQAAAPVDSTSQESLDWLNPPEEPSARPEEKTAEEDLGWLKALDDNKGEETPAETVSPFTTPPTGPLAGDSIPDWLKSATEEPSMPAPGALSDWFRESDAGAKQETPPATPPPEPAEKDIFAGSPESPSPTNKDMDSLFAGEMPDWLTGAEKSAEDLPAMPASEGASLAPVDLPAWVQAMQPVESVLSEAPNVDSQPTEKEGPLAGLRGVIPPAPIGSALRPKAISLKLQASDEQQAGAMLFEQILAGESNPKPLVSTDRIASQRALRWALSGLFLVVLGAMTLLGTQSMPISADLPEQVGFVSNAVGIIPQNSSVLVVVDYEPALAGELEAVAGPMLDQMALMRRPRLSFVSTSPNGSALADRLLRNTNLSLPAPNGLDYKPGIDYFNLGFLPGGASGVIEFVQSPASAIPSAGTAALSGYSAVILLTDHSESARVWVEQLDARRRVDIAIVNQPLLVAASAQAGPLLEPYVDSRQITGMVNGLSEAARYEYVNGTRPGMARRYWDSFGTGMLMAVAILVIGSLWSLAAGLRARRAGTEAG